MGRTKKKIKKKNNRTNYFNRVYRMTKEIKNIKQCQLLYSVKYSLDFISNDLIRL